MTKIVGNVRHQLKKMLKTIFFFGFSDRSGRQMHYHENAGGRVYR